MKAGLHPGHVIRLLQGQIKTKEKLKERKEPSQRCSVGTLAPPSLESKPTSLHRCICHFASCLVPAFYCQPQNYLCFSAVDMLTCHSR